MIKYVLLFFYFYKILTAFNKLKIISEVVLLLPNTDRLQQDYVRGCTWQLKKVKTTYIYRFHELVFDWGDNSLGCFNRWTQNYELWTDRLKTMSCEPIDSKLWAVNRSTQNYELWTDRLKTMGCEPIDSKLWAVDRSTQIYGLWTNRLKNLSCEPIDSKLWAVATVRTTLKDNWNILPEYPPSWLPK